MEINITHFFRNAAPMDYSASVAEIGQDAGTSTWNAAKDDSEDYPLIDTDEKREALRAHIKGFGAWDAEEIARMTDTDLNALFIQMVSGDIRESGIDTANPDWKAYEEKVEQGQIGGSFWPGDDGDIYYAIGD